MLIFEVLPLNAIAATPTYATIAFMIMPLAVRLIIINVELGGLERRSAYITDEASLVISAT